MNRVLCFFLGHVTGYTDQGLPILPIGRVDRLYNLGPLRPIIVKDDWYYPSDFFDSYSQEIFRCARCGSQLVEHAR